MSVFTLMSSAAATNVGGVVDLSEFVNADRTFQASGQTTDGAGSATILIEVSNDRNVWITLDTLTLTLSTTASSDFYSGVSKWAYVRANLTAITGTNAAVTVTGCA